MQSEKINIVIAYLQRFPGASRARQSEKFTIAIATRPEGIYEK